MWALPLALLSATALLKQPAPGDCILQPVDADATVFLGVDRQSLVLDGRGQCDALDEVLLEAKNANREAGFTFQAQTSTGIVEFRGTLSSDSGRYRFVPRPAPKLPETDGSWAVFASGPNTDKLAEVVLSLEKLEVTTNLRVEYPGRPTFQNVADRYPGTEAAIPPSDQDAVVNAVTVQLPPGISPKSMGDLSWSVVLRGADVDLFDDATPPVAVGRKIGNYPDVSLIRFRARSPVRAPIHATLELARASEVVLSFDVELAKGASRRSIPFPVGRATHVQCPRQAGSPYWRAGDASGTVSADNKSIKLDACKLEIRCEELLDAIKDRHGVEDAALVKQLARLYGPQRVKVKVVDRSNGKSTEIERIVRIEDPQHLEIPLDFPTESTDPNNLYLVDLRHVDDDAKEADARTSVAQIRPRGAFGLPPARSRNGEGVRLYATVPVNLAGFRFPASGRDLANSSQSPNVDVTTLDTGLLLAMEIWNYNVAANASAIPVYFASGMLFSTIENGKNVVRPNFVLGGGLSLPLLQGTQQLDTSLALGLYWSVDLRRAEPFRTGNHFMVTLGANILSLFGAGSAKKSESSRSTVQQPQEASSDETPAED